MSLSFFDNTKELTSGKTIESTEDTPDEADRKRQLLSDFIYALTGKRLKFVDIDLEKQKKHNEDSIMPQRVGWGINLSYSSEYSEQSTVSFSAKGVIKTTDGREIQMNLNLNMSRSFYTSTSLNFKAGDALLDPLVINLGNTPSSLSDRKISFDIDIDGSREEISLPVSASGFLSLDRNENGIIDDGSELFGPKTGDGFSELKEYDEDKNGWIDESDSIYDNLLIWQHDSSGKSSLIALGVAGVGAIYLGSSQTEFKYADSLNNTLGQLHRTGIYLKENGTAGTMQHIDLAI